MRHYPARRGVAALLLAVCLNLALVPCTMALEVVDEGHDCCPPELKLEPAECCQLDEATLDIRSTSKFDDDDSDIAAPQASPLLPVLAHPLIERRRHRRHLVAIRLIHRNSIPISTHCSASI